MSEALSGMIGKDAQTIMAYANANMKLGKAADELMIDYRTLASRLDFIYKRTKLNPRRFRDLAELVRIIDEVNDE